VANYEDDVWRLEREAVGLERLRSAGLPVQHRGIVRWTDPDGSQHTGVLMARLEGVSKGDITTAAEQALRNHHPFVQRGVLDISQLKRIPDEWRNVNDRTIAGLQRIRQVCREQGIIISDPQYMVAADGSVTIIDGSAGVFDYTAKMLAQDPDLARELASFEAKLDADIARAEALAHLNATR
jgi:hypothetical protein